LDVFETILARRSVRSYADATLERKTVHTLLEAAVRAPTVVREEPLVFVVVQDRQLLRRLSDSAKPLFADGPRRGDFERPGLAFEVLISPDFNIFYDAGTLIVICARPVGPFFAADCWLAAENIMLAACAMGLGTCVVGAALAVLKDSEIAAQLGIPAEFAAIAPIVVGQSRGDVPATARREPLVVAWH
jgi:nitroreductase